MWRERKEGKVGPRADCFSPAVREMRDIIFTSI